MKGIQIERRRIFHAINVKWIVLANYIDCRDKCQEMVSIKNTLPWLCVSAINSFPFGKGPFVRFLHQSAGFIVQHTLRLSIRYYVKVQI